MFQLLSYMLGWLTFYHQGYVDLEDFRSYDSTLRQLLQKVYLLFLVLLHLLNLVLLPSPTLLPLSLFFLLLILSLSFAIVSVLPRKI